MIISTLKNVLVIDDDKDFCDGTIGILEANGYSVYQANNEKQAVKKIQEIQPEIILLDLNLGRTSGLSILKYVKENDLKSECIIITAFSCINSAIDALRQGAYDYCVFHFHLMNSSKSADLLIIGGPLL